MAFGGKWWLIHEDERFDRDTGKWFNLRRGEVLVADATVGNYGIEAGELRLALDLWSDDLLLLPPSEMIDGSIVKSALDEDASVLVDETFEWVLQKDGPWVDELTEQNRAMAGRFSTIDVSMYPLGTPGLAELYDATTYEEIEAALAGLPLAKYTHAEAA